MVNLLDIQLHDGSRQFARLPANDEWRAVRDHVRRLSGAEYAELLSGNNIHEAWLEFVYKGQVFTILDQFAEYWFFVRDPHCQDVVLCEVKAHWEELLGAANVVWLEAQVLRDE